MYKRQQQSCKTDEQKPADSNALASNSAAAGPARTPEEIARYNEIISKTFFTKEEFATITILADIIIPKDEKSGSASDAKVADFIEFIVKDQPNHQVPMRGGLRWLEMCIRDRYGILTLDLVMPIIVQVAPRMYWLLNLLPGALPMDLVCHFIGPCLFKIQHMVYIFTRDGLH